MQPLQLSRYLHSPVDCRDRDQSLHSKRFVHDVSELAVEVFYTLVVGYLIWSRWQSQFTDLVGDQWKLAVGTLGRDANATYDCPLANCCTLRIDAYSWQV